MDNPTSSRKSFREPVMEIATVQDAPSIKLIIDAAYSKYIKRLSMLPAAMKMQNDQLVETQTVYVLRVGDDVVGSVILSREGDSIMVNNLVVAPSAQGHGYGRLLMKYAENMAREQGLAALTLFANVKMHENIAWYTKIGFTETGRKTEDGFNRVYFRKELV